ncbi:MAG TPA: phosphoribosylglycinamide formyltransferase [Caulobacteraceae bacterium]|jgi:phosphoribosylglycinamide formyltransferase-1
MQPTQPLKLAFLASSGGGSMRAIVAAIEAGTLAAEARLVVSNRREAPALVFATEHGIDARFIPTVPDAHRADTTLLTALREAGADLVVLSGYLRRVGPWTLRGYAGRILNIHPALLPKYGGQGMYGMAVHTAVAAAGERVSGATIHLVDGEYDHGATLAQAEVALSAGDDAATIQAKVSAIEPDLFVETLRRIAGGTLALPR